MTKTRSSEFFGQMCSGEFFLKHALPNFITRGPVTPVGSTVTDALLLSCDACTSSLSLSSESLDSIINNYFKFSLEESGKTIDMIFIDAKQEGGRKDISKYN